MDKKVKRVLIDLVGYTRSDAPASEFKLINGQRISYTGFNNIIHAYYGDASEHDCKGVTRKCFFEFVANITTNENARQMFPTIMTLVRFLYGPNTDMISQGIAQINKFLKVTFGERSRAFKAGRLILRLKPAEIRERIKRSTLRREAKNKVRKQISFRLIKKMVGDLLDSKELIDRIILVATACGARLTEILVISSFRAADTKNIAILRQAKERLSKGDIGRSIIKPVLFIKAPDLENLVHRIRAEIERDEKLREKTRRELTVHFDNRVNKRLREFLGKQFRFHDLRAIYGAISYERYGEDESLAAWLQEVLGHARGNIAASLAYSTVRLVE